MLPKRLSKVIIALIVLTAIVGVTSIILHQQSCIPNNRNDETNKDLMNQEYDEALESSTALGGGEDAPAKQLAQVQLGDTVEFGRMIHEGSLQIDTGKMKWLVIARKDNRVLLLSDENIASKPYNISLKKVTWETCSIRKWLNGEFLERFTDLERKLIAVSRLSNQNNPSSGAWGGNETIDRVFLLSIEEVKNYLPSVETRVGKARKGDFEFCSYGKQAWLLRSVGEYETNAAYVLDNGFIDEYGTHVDYRDLSAWNIRPAMWVNVSLVDVEDNSNIAIPSTYQPILGGGPNFRD